MRAHIELSAFVDTREPVTAGDIDRLAETFAVYLDACKGIPELDYTIHENSVCICGSSAEGKSLGKVANRMYIRKMITEALSESGMEVPGM